MQFTDLFLCTLALASAAVAQGTNSGSGSTTVHVVKVGENGLTFSPDQLTAAAGDMVQFQFYPKNHSVVQSTFDQPCMPMGSMMMNGNMNGNMNGMNMDSQMGFNSGFMPVSAGSTMQPVFTIMVNDTKPIWIYCGQKGHCQKGMVMAINVAEGSNKTLAAYKAMAMQADTASGSGSMSGGSATGSMGSMGSMTSMMPSMTSMMSGSMTMTGAPVQTKNAAAKPVVNSLGLAGLFIAGLGFFGL